MNANENFDMEPLNEVNFEATLETFTVFVPTDVMNLSRVPDDYDYEMETSHSTFFWDELLPTLIVYCLTFVLGLVGNVLIIFTIFRYRKMKSTTNVFLASLASSDLLLILFCIPVKGFSKNFSSIFSSNEPDIPTQSTLPNLSQPSNSAFSQMKAVLDTFLIKEDEEVEEEIYLKHHVEDNFISQSSSDSIVETDISPFDIDDSIFSHSTSEKLTLMESNLCSSDTHSKLELLMSKLSEEIKKCSDFMKKFYEQKSNKFVTCSSTKLSASDSKIELNKAAGKGKGKKSLNSFGWTSSEPLVYPVFAYSTGNMSFEEHDVLRPKSKKHKYLQELQKEEFNQIQKTANKNLNIKDTVHAGSQKENDLKSTESIFSCKSVSSIETLQTTRFTEKPKKVQNIIKEFPCCDDCRLLKKRIVKLEQELEKIEKRMPLYPKEYQESIKDCLESLNVTSETFLKRLKSCAKLRYFESKNRKICKHDSKRSTSSPGPIIHKSSRKKLDVKSSNSDYQLNVGMEITMENVDPVTGKKLYPEVNRDTEQEGNIQCRVFKDEEKPILVMDTDFSYNPNTGMLFKKRGSHSTKSPSTDLIIPFDSIIKKAPSAVNLAGNFDRFQTYECPEDVNKNFEPELVRPKVPKRSERDLALQIPCSSFMDPEVTLDVFPSLLSTKKSKSKDSTEESRITQSETPHKSRLSLQEVINSKGGPKRSRSASQESKKSKRSSWFSQKNIEKSGKPFSRIPIRRKPTPSPVCSNADSMSVQNSMTSFYNIPLQPNCYSTSSATSGVFFKNREKVRKTPHFLHRMFLRPLSRERSFINFMQKSTQTYEKLDKFTEEPKTKAITLNAGIQTKSEYKHFGVQVAGKRMTEGMQNFPPAPVDLELESDFESQSLSLTESSLKSICGNQSRGKPSTSTATVNVAVQADRATFKKPHTISVGFQTNLPSEESIKYMNDLRIQKKVNMAIAELCFHLSQKEEEEV